MMKSKLYIIYSLITDIAEALGKSRELHKIEFTRLMNAENVEVPLLNISTLCIYHNNTVHTANSAKSIYDTKVARWHNPLDIPSSTTIFL